jgi:hypothetical protein
MKIDFSYSGKMLVQLDTGGGFPDAPYIICDLNNISSGCSQ